MTVEFLFTGGHNVRKAAPPATLLQIRYRRHGRLTIYLERRPAGNNFLRGLGPADLDLRFLDLLDLVVPPC